MSTDQGSTRTCPTDWLPLLDHRFDPEVAEPVEWPSLRAHLDGCARCREEACAIDPTLAFQRLPEVRVDAADIAAMKQAVATLRRGRELETASAATERSLPVGRGRFSLASFSSLSRSRSPLQRRLVGLAAALVLVVAGGSLVERALQGPPPEPGPQAAQLGMTYEADPIVERIEIVTDPRLILDDDLLLAQETVADGPIVESIDPGSTVYTLASQPSSTRAAVAWVINPAVELRPPGV